MADDADVIVVGGGLAGLAAGSLFGPSRVKKPKRAAGPAAQLVAV